MLISNWNVLWMTGVRSSSDWKTARDECSRMGPSRRPRGRVAKVWFDVSEGTELGRERASEIF